jgi:threonine/homoserine/homoserine lactone efflux protein
MTLVQWLTLAGVCFLGAASPGPSLALIAQTSLGSGRTAGIAAAWSHALGIGGYALLTALGIAALLASEPLLFSAIKLAGAAYLLYLAWGALRGAGAGAGEAIPGEDTAARNHSRRAARDGFAIALLNPKIALFMLALFSQFLRPGYGWPEVLLMAATATIIDGAWYTLVATLLTREDWLQRLRTKASLIDRCFALLLALLAGFIIMDTLLGG